LSIKNNLKVKVNKHNDIHLLIEKLALDANSIKDILYGLKNETTNFVGLIAGVEDDKCSLTLIIDEELVKSKNLNAGTIIREIAKHIQGGGGGQAFFATAGGKNSNGIDDALKAFTQLI
jgi:alanyl-tRNA synthetase